MIVRNRMKADPVVLKKEDSLRKAMSIFQKEGFRHIPVVDRGKVVGMVTDQDLHRITGGPTPTASIQELHYVLEKVKVEEFMTKDPFTVSPETYVEDAAQILYEKKIGALPVVENNYLVGIITKNDILETFLDILGLTTPGKRVEVVLEDRTGALSDATRVIKDLGVYLISGVTMPQKTKGKRHTLFRVAPDQVERVKEALRKSGPPVISVMD